MAAPPAAMVPPAVPPAAPYPDIPVVDKQTALICLVVNLFFPGIGTIVAGVQGVKPQIGKGILQLILALIVVGWIWALITSLQVLKNATWKESQDAHARPA